MAFALAHLDWPCHWPGKPRRLPPRSLSRARCGGASAKGPSPATAMSCSRCVAGASSRASAR
eukprot:6273981-Alexandrium_andersonii.AAC.1